LVTYPRPTRAPHGAPACRTRTLCQAYAPPSGRGAAGASCTSSDRTLCLCSHHSRFMHALMFSMFTVINAPGPALGPARNGDGLLARPLAWLANDLYAPAFAVGAHTAVPRLYTRAYTVTPGSCAPRAWRSRRVCLMRRRASAVRAVAVARLSYALAWARHPRRRRLCHRRTRGAALRSLAVCAGARSSSAPTRVSPCSRAPLRRVLVLRAGLRSPSCSAPARARPTHQRALVFRASALRASCVHGRARSLRGRVLAVHVDRARPVRRRARACA
jgi:hypothetical protein